MNIIILLIIAILNQIYQHNKQKAVNKIFNFYLKKYNSITIKKLNINNKTK